MSNNDTQRYGTGSDSTVGTQLRTDYFNKNALDEAAKESYFGQQADTMAMPKHMGKTIKQYHYLPLLDDKNINDQGIDAAGLTATFTGRIGITLPDTVLAPNGMNTIYAVSEGTTAALAAAQVLAEYRRILLTLGVTNQTSATAAASKATLEALGWKIDIAQGITAGILAKSANGNLYGSSKDVGAISAKLPALTENGGRVNRVGFKRVELEGTLEKFGFFDEYTQESLDFDTDAQLEQHISTEMVKGANEMTEDALQIDLLESAGVTRFGGVATATSELTGVDADTVSSITYTDLMKLNITLDENRTPKHTKILTGSRMIDTEVVNSARYIYIGNELIPMVKAMKDLHGQPAFVSVEKYAAGNTIARGEIGKVDQFRIVVVPEMLHWEGAGAVAGVNSGYRTGVAVDGKGGVPGAERYNVYPMLVIGSGSFTTVGFNTGGSGVKFSIKHVKPGSEQSYGQHDPFGEKGFMSIKWYYGFMVLRPERIAVCKAVAEW